jgi:hypothetical protein
VKEWNDSRVGFKSMRNVRQRFDLRVRCGDDATRKLRANSGENQVFGVGAGVN